ncbi:MAG: DNA recombination/repair protein RecA, partial [Spirochaetia bacterium]
MLEAALQTNLIEKAGSWYSYGKERIGQGVENARLFLESNPAVYADIEKKVRAAFFPKPGAAAPAETAVEGGAAPRLSKPEPAVVLHAEADAEGDPEEQDAKKELF